MIPSIDIERIHKLDPELLIFIAIIHPIFLLLVNYLLTTNFFQPISVWSDYLINPTLQANLIILLIWGLVIFKIGKHNLESIWLNKKKLRNGIIVGVIFWLIIQAVVLLYLLFSANSLSLNQNVNIEIGLFLGQLFGNALTEEFIFRGIFFLQLYILFRKRFSNRAAFIGSIVASQLLFAVSHLPNRILVKYYENLVIDQIKLFIIGVLLAIFYIRTNNFALTLFIHSLLNYQLRIFETNFPYPLIALTIFLLSIIFWDKIKMKFG